MTDRKTDAAVKSFFEDEVLTLAARMKAAGHSFLNVKQDPRSATYYLPRSKRTMDRSDFEALAELAPDSLARLLAAFWKARKNEALVPLAASIAKLATALHATQRPDEDVSPFVYMMY